MLKIFKYFVFKLMKLRMIYFILIMSMLLICSLSIFITSRTILTTIKGYNEVSKFSSPNNYVTTISGIDDSNYDEQQLNEVYEYLNENYTYAIFTDAYESNLNNDYSIRTNIAYINEQYYKFNHFKISEGSTLNFNYSDDEVPVLVGEGLKNNYPVGSTFEDYNSVNNTKSKYKVVGILEKDTSKSLIYGLDVSNYYNFTILVPVDDPLTLDEEKKSNSLFNMIILNSNEEEINKLQQYIYDKIGLELLFDNEKTLNDYYNSTIYIPFSFLIFISICLTLLVVFLSLWISNTIISVLIKDFTINFAVGLSYYTVNKIFIIIYSILITFNIIFIYGVILLSNLNNWMNNYPSQIVFGTLKIDNIDLISLLVVLLINIIIVLFITKHSVKRIKKIPISLGVLDE